MKGLFAWIVGTFLVLSIVTGPTARANENDNDNNYSSNDHDRYLMTERGVPYLEPGMAVVPGTRVYYLSDNPKYDLSGSRDSWLLVEDGGAFKADSKGPTAFVSTGMYPHEVAVMPAEYRQDWLAVAAGDRPVRTVRSVKASMMAPPMAVVPSGYVMYTREGPERVGTSYSSATSGTHETHYRAVKHVAIRRHRPTQTTVAHHRTYHRHHAAMASYRPRRTTWTRTSSTYATAEPALSTTTTREYVRDHDLYQIQGSWYRNENGVWYRGYSWRGPFVHVSRVSVPREVISSEDHPEKAPRTVLEEDEED
jgi:hypothetical protein